MAEYKFIFYEDSPTGIATAPRNIMNSPAQGMLSDALAAEDNDNSEFSSGFTNKASKSIVMSNIISPLNSATGGLASPAYSLGKSLLSGAGAAAIGGGVAGLALAAVNLAITKIQDRLAKVEAEASAAGNRDNLLLRTGLASQATLYESSFSGVRKTTRN